MEERPNLARRLRRIVHLVLALGVVLVAITFLPGRRVYDDANNCLGRAFAGFATTEHRHDDCSPSYTELKATEPAGGWPLVGFAIVVAIGAGLVHRRPRRRYAWAWVASTALAAVALFVTTFELHFFEYVETLWPAAVLDIALGTILVLVLLAAPAAALLSRERAGGLPPADRSEDR
ncbi:MAG: hypothetical protein ABI467_17750 [Kofleriaceae bacterium]